MVLASLVLISILIVLYMAYKSIKELTKNMPKDDQY